jgi:hypothetical protein
MNKETKYNGQLVILREAQHAVLGCRKNVTYLVTLLGYGEENDYCGE